MGFNEKENSLEYWDNIHSKYERNEIKLDDWLDKFETIIDSCSTPILDLGCGSGNDTLYLINKNKQVISCDQSSNAINNIKKNFPEVYDTKCFNMLDGMPFDNNSFELIIADLCLHYFKEKDTFEDMKIVQEMYARGFEFVKIDIYRSKANRFQIVDGKLMPAFSTIDGLGDKAAEMIEDEASKGKFLSREDFKNRCKVSEKVVETMADLGLMGDLPHSNQISLMDFMEM